MKYEREMDSMKTTNAYTLFFKNYPDIVNVSQLSEMLGGVSHKTCYKLLKDGDIKSFIIARKYRIPKIYVLEYLGLMEKFEE